MIEQDREAYGRMVGVFAIVQIPQLKMSIKGSIASFTWAKGFLASMPLPEFYSFEPIEIVMLLEAALESHYSVPKRAFRSSLKGWKRDPFSSQNH